MRHKRLLLALALLLLLPITASRSEAKGDINFMLGFKQIDDFADLQESFSGEDDLGSQPDLGVEMTFRGADWPIGVAVDILGSARQEEVSEYAYPYFIDLEVDASTAEVDVGVRKIWELPGKAVRPYVGGGLALARGEVELTGDAFIPLIGLITVSESDDGTGVGYWLGGGVYWRLGERFNIGLNARYSSAEVELEDADEDVDVGGIHAGLLLGWGW